MFNFFFITCDEATTICDKSQYDEATFFEKIKLNLHLFNCKKCILYTKQNKIMSNLFKMKTSNCKQEIKCLSSIYKNNLKEQFKEFEI